MNRVGILAALSIVPLVSAQASEWGQCGVGGQYFFIEIVRIITLRIHIGYRLDWSNDMCYGDGVHGAK